MLRLIRSVVTTVSYELGFSPDEASLIELAVDEACTNVIHHAYDESAVTRTAAPEMRVQIRPAPDRLAVRIIDEGVGLPHTGALGVSGIEEYASQPEPKGLGSYIIAQFMDEVVYDSPPGSGTVLSMVKYLHRS
jgi:anti-sigma regulatory factor (Ser/Thr protein kinase)